MVTRASRVFLPIGLVTLGLCAAYALFAGDALGAVLLLTTATAAGFVAVTVGGAGDEPVLRAAMATLDGDEGDETPPQPGGGGWPLLAAVAVALLLLGFVVGRLAAFAGIGAALVAGIGWLGRLTREQTGREVDLMPLGLPVLGLTTIASLMFFMSRMLLAVSETASWVLALVVAAAVLAVAAVVSLRPQMSPRALVGVLAVGSILMAGGGLVAAAKGERPIPRHDAGAAEGDHGEPGAGEERSEGADAAHGGASEEGGEGPDNGGVGPAVTVKVVAHNIAFDLKELSLKARTRSRIEFENADAEINHNIGIYKDKTAAVADKVFIGRAISGPATTTYEFEAPPPGTYYFQCDIHPNMAGEVIVT